MASHEAPSAKNPSAADVMREDGGGDNDEEFPNIKTGFFVLFPIVAGMLVLVLVLVVLPLLLFICDDVAAAAAAATAADCIDALTLSVSMDIPIISTNMDMSAFISASVHGNPSFVFRLDPFLEWVLLLLVLLDDAVDTAAAAAAAAAAAVIADCCCC